LRTGPEEILVDVRGLKCPLPVLKTERRMAPHPGGTRFHVLASDPLAVVDIPNFCREAGHLLLGSEKDGETLSFRIEKGGG
jgi:tRNA 2-thiouridine synthesizing protein A